MPRVVVPSESEKRAADQLERRRRVRLAVLAAAGVAAAAALGVNTWREQSRKVSADTVFVSAPAWPKAEPRQASPRGPQPNKEYLLQLGAYASMKDAEALAARLTGLAWPVSIVVPVTATDSLNKVILSGFEDKAVARRVADSLGAALGVQVTIMEPMGTRTK